MQYLFGSELPHLTAHFRDYIRAKYNVELVLQSYCNEEHTEIHSLFLPSQSPFSAEIMAETDAFLKDPFANIYQQASWQSGDIHRGKRSLNLPTFLAKQSFPWQQSKFAILITILCLIVYIFGVLGWQQDILLFSHFPAGTEQKNELWRYFSHSLVHLSFWHLAFNLSFWWLFATEIEKQTGRLKLILLYFISALLTGIAQNAISGYGFFGLSGVVYTVLGYVFIRNYVSKTQLFDLPQGFFTMLIVGIATGFISPYFGIEMGNTAHIVGLLIGLIWGYFEEIKR